jgi:hypothetical protein
MPGALLARIASGRPGRLAGYPVKSMARDATPGEKHFQDSRQDRSK